MTEPASGEQTPDVDEGFDLDPIEIRVLAVLIEKAFVTPDNYPLSVNAILTGCNQLTGREPAGSRSWPCPNPRSATASAGCSAAS